ncbi:hypothetical protein V6N12_016034 [Hibiscus sabdariffa]|uniref:Uncharacterized protein n=1 Tax=Hibiscus sabdariffa TaxID=183260 RepID=A0ABR1ZH80_9ROSI
MRYLMCLGLGVESDCNKAVMLLQNRSVFHHMKMMDKQWKVTIDASERQHSDLAQLACRYTFGYHVLINSLDSTGRLLHSDFTTLQGSLII